MTDSRFVEADFDNEVFNSEDSSPEPSSHEPEVIPTASPTIPDAIPQLYPEGFPKNKPTSSSDATIRLLQEGQSSNTNFISLDSLDSTWSPYILFKCIIAILKYYQEGFAARINFSPYTVLLYLDEQLDITISIQETNGIKQPYMLNHIGSDLKNYIPLGKNPEFTALSTVLSDMADMPSKTILEYKTQVEKIFEGYKASEAGKSDQMHSRGLKRKLYNTEVERLNKLYERSIQRILRSLNKRIL